MTCDDDLFALLNEVKQRAKRPFGFRGSNFAHPASNPGPVLPALF